jgi:sorbitol-specific phosphotransferase system component IIC
MSNSEFLIGIIDETVNIFGEEGKLFVDVICSIVSLLHCFIVKLPHG